jgi:hypothetical protein
MARSGGAREDLRGRPSVVRRLAAVVVVLVLTAVVAQGACLPHTHIGFGVYNADHDLTLLGAASSVGPVPVVPLLFVFVLTTALLVSKPSLAIVSVVRDAESRAPPA